jgi:asparagine synthase (glutamine-hydrolysing)
MGDDLVNLLDGKFSFVVSEVSEKGRRYLAARDPIGVTSLYIGYGRDGSVLFSSEMKALKDDCDIVEEFPPGHYWSSATNKFERWYKAKWTEEEIPTNELDLELLQKTLEKAVVKRLMTDVPYGVLLSGGLDSSLIASIAARHAAMRVEEDEKSPAWWPRLHSFSIGLEGSPDLKAAKEVANFLGTAHHEFTFTVQEGIDALSDVIYRILSMLLYKWFTIGKILKLMMSQAFVLLLQCISSHEE